MPILTPQQSEGSVEATIGRPLVTAPETGVSEVQPSPSAVAPNMELTRRHRGWKRTAIAALVIAAIGAGVAWFTGRGGESAPEGSDSADAARSIRAVEAEQRDLAETQEVDGEFTYRDTTTIVASGTGIVTAIAEPEARLVRGDAAYELDTVPAVVLWGETPLYRRLERGVEDGRDVRLLEENLSALGYTALGTLVVDDEYDKATQTAVEEWEADSGAVVDGAVDPSQVVVLPGPAVVDTLSATLGGSVQPGSPTLTVRIAEEVAAYTFATEGRITDLATVGTPLTTGDVAYEIDTLPVAVIAGEVMLERELTVGSAGDDVRELEAALLGLGYDDDGELEADDTFDEHTAAAVSEWEDDLGLEVDGVVQLGQYIVVRPGSTVTHVELERGDDVLPGLAAIETGVSTRVVTGAIDSSDDDLLAAGAEVTVEFPDGTQVRGTITEIDASTTTDPLDGSTRTGFEVDLAEIPETVAGRDRVDVEIGIVSELATDATVVPASALVSVGDGTYAVEVVDGSATRFVGVEPGLFADGFVAVTGIEPGTAVVVPE